MTAEKLTVTREVMAETMARLADAFPRHSEQLRALCWSAKAEAVRVREGVKDHYAGE